MKLRKKLLLYFVCVTGLFLVGMAVIMACAEEPDPYDYYTSFFHPSVQSQKDFGAFYFTDYRFTYSDDEPASEAAINATEWANYLGEPVKAADIEKIMYNLDSAGKKRVFNFFEQDSPLADSLSASKFLPILKAAAHAPARKYYQFALQAERLGNSNYNYWDPEPLDTAGLKSEASQALLAAINESDSFVKLRYFYQAQKLNHYAKNYIEAKNIYDQYISKTPSKSHVKGWALALKAGEERRLGDTVQAAYLFSKVFAEYPERRIQAYRNYHYIRAPFNEVLKLAQTPQEKANLYAIVGFANSEIDITNLESAYKYAPSSPLVGTLLVREINKLEQYYLTPALNNNTDHFYSAKPSGDTKLQPVITTNKRLLWAGLIVLLAGIAGLIVGFKKQTVKPVIKVMSGILVVAGVAIMIWFAVSRPHTGSEIQHTPKGSFFVAMPDSVKTKYEAHIEKLRSFCNKLSSDAQYAEPQMGTLVNAYLYFMQNKPDDGLAALNQLDEKALNSKMGDQKQILSLLLSAQRIKQINAVDEATLLPALKWLNGKVLAGVKPKTEMYPPTLANVNQFAITQRNFYTYVLAPAYLRQRDTAKAALVMLNSQNSDNTSYRYSMFKQMPDFWYNYLHANQLKQIINWKINRPAEPYMVFLSDGLKQVDNSNLYELLGTIQLREHHYQDAVASFSVAESKLNLKRSEFTVATEGDPFISAINDYPHTPGKKYTKLAFAKKMAILDTKLKENPKDADAWFQMATGIYNTSTYGNSWNLISYSWSCYDFGRKRLYDYDTDYIKTSLAKQYYLKARDLNADAEFKAKCTFMAAKCEQKEHVAPSFMDNYDTYDQREKAYTQQLKQSSYFKQMEQYKTTAFYKKAIDECSYLSDFITPN